MLHPTLQFKHAQLFSHVHVDLVKMPRSGRYDWILTMIDRYSRWAEAVPLEKPSAAKCVGAFEAVWMARYGAPAMVT